MSTLFYVPSKERPCWRMMGSDTCYSYPLQPMLAILKKCDAPKSPVDTKELLKSSPSLPHWHFSFCRKVQQSFISIVKQTDMRLSDTACVSMSPLRSTASTCSSIEEAMRQSLFPADPFGLPTSSRSHETRAAVASGRAGKIPQLLWRCSSSARNLISRDRREDFTESNSLRRGSITAETRSSRAPSQHECTVVTPRSSILLREGSEDLQLFREEAEYSDYLSAQLTGRHIERSGDGVVFYGLEVHLSKQRWSVVRRFSEFRTLRRQLIKHFSRGKRRHQPCPICENVLASILETPFPSRQLWGSHLFSSSSVDSFGDEIIEKRKAQLQAFVAMCLLTIRSLRQHVRVLPDDTECEISVALRVIEEFLGLIFTRYLGFLGERGIVDQMAKSSRERLTLQRQQDERTLALVAKGD